MTPSSIAGIFGIVALALLVLLILKQVTHRAVDSVAKCLSLLFLLGLTALTWNVVYLLYAFYEQWPHLSNALIGPVFWIGPAFYGYVKRVSQNIYPLARLVSSLHWLPSLIATLLLLPYYRLPLEEKMTYLLNPADSGWITTVMRILWTAVFVQILLYIYFCQPYLREYRLRITRQHTDPAQNNIGWLQLFCYGFVAYVLLYSLLSFTGLGATEYSQVLSMAMHAFVVALAYAAIGQSTLVPVIARGAETEAGKYQRSGLREHSARFLIDKLNRGMAEHQYYLDSDISLEGLANELSISSHHLSQLLNEHLNKTFYEYINEQRIRYAQDLMLNAPGKTIMDVSIESGYNNKNSFNNAFKRHAGMTPSAFRQKQQNNSTSL